MGIDNFFDDVLGFDPVKPPKPPKPQGPGASKSNSDQHIPVLYGRLSRIDGIQAFKNVSDPPDGDDLTNDLLHVIMVWGEGVDSVDRIYLNDIPLEDPRFDEKVPEFPEGEDGIFGRLMDGLNAQVEEGGRWVYAFARPRGGTFGDSGLADAGYDGARYLFNDLAITWVRLEWSPTGELNGEPTIKADITGRRVSHVSTGQVAPSSNPVNQLYDYLTNETYGKGLPSSAIHVGSFQASVTKCDEQIETYEGSGQYRSKFTSNIYLDTANGVLDNVKTLLRSCNAKLPPIDGRLTLVIEGDDPYVPFELSDGEGGEIVSWSSITPSESNDRYNQVVVKYYDPSQKGRAVEIVFPKVDSELDLQWLAEDNGIRHSKNITIETCDNAFEAKQQAEYFARVSRDSLNFDVVAFGNAMRLTPGDIVPVNIETAGFVSKPFRVDGVIYKNNGDVELALREHQPASYQSANDEDVAPIPDTVLPLPGTVMPPENLRVEVRPDGVVRVLWDSSYNAFLVGLYRNSDRLRVDTIVTPYIDIESVDAGNYRLLVRAINSLSLSSNWVSIDFTVAVPSEPSVTLLSRTHNSLSLRATLVGQGVGTVYQWEFMGVDQEADGNPVTADVYNRAGLDADTEYFFRVRTVNPAGTSGWLVVSFTTDTIESLVDALQGQLPRESLDEATQQLINQLDRELPDNIVEPIEALQINTRDLQGYVARLDRRTEQTALQVLENLGVYASFTQEYERRTAGNEQLIDAVVQVDPDSGQIVNLAYQYADDRYSEAVQIIDGVNATISQQTVRISQAEDSITEQSALIQQQADNILLRATYSQVSSAIAEAIDAITPAYSWQFNTGLDGWSGGTWNAAGYVAVVDGSPVSISGIDYDADENPAIRLRVRLRAGGVWTGNVTWNGSDSIVLSAPGSEDVWESPQVTLTAGDSYTGSITSLSLDLGDVDIDYIEVGKPSAGQQQIGDIESRVVTVEQELDASNARWGQYVTTAYFNANRLTVSDVEQTIDGWDAEYQIVAAVQQLNENNTVQQASAAYQWISGADSTIESGVRSVLAEEGGVDEQIGQVNTTLTEVTEQVSAANNSASSVRRLVALHEDQRVAEDIQQVVADSERRRQLIEHAAQIALANEQLTALVTDLLSQVERVDEMTARQDTSEAQIRSQQSALASNVLAITQSISQQRSELETADENVLAAASQETQTRVSDLGNSLTESLNTQRSELEVALAEGDAAVVSEAEVYTRTAIGYCVDADGNITSHTDAVACAAVPGNSWVSGPLAEFVRGLTVVTGGGTATLQNLAQVFEDIEGQLIARGGMLSNVDGKLTGFVSNNDGTETQLDFIADNFRVGVVDSDDNFIPLFYLDNVNKQLIYRGQVILGDGYEVNGQADIRALDGVDGQDGQTTYTWIRYADSAAGSGISNNPAGKDYIGFAYNRAVPQESNNPADYVWSLIRGAQGDQGVPGDPGVDGQTTYTWIKYSPNANGSDLTDLPQSDTNYIGIAVNRSSAQESNSASDYVWSRWRGDQGVPGADGQTTYTWIRYADSAAGSGISNNPAGKDYIGFAYNRAVPQESNNPADYVWSLVRGAQGDQGVPGDPGVDGQTTYTWIKYSPNANGSDLTDLPQTDTNYIGIAVNRSSAQESNNASDYVWSRWRGDQGDPGQDGQPGADGQDGARGAGRYTYAQAQNPAVWNNANAATAVGGAPVEGDIVTIYSASNPASEITRMYQSGVWQNFILRVHGNALIEGTAVADEIRAGAVNIIDTLMLQGQSVVVTEIHSAHQGQSIVHYEEGPFPGGPLPFGVDGTQVATETLNMQGAKEGSAVDIDLSFRISCHYSNPEPDSFYTSSFNLEITIEKDDGSTIYQEDWPVAVHVTDFSVIVRDHVHVVAADPVDAGEHTYIVRVALRTTFFGSNPVSLSPSVSRLQMRLRGAKV